jgi:multicomponent Na+:H+ antiporter subunit D
MILDLPPGLLLILGAFILPFLRGRVQAAAAVALPVLGLAQLAALPDGVWGQVGFLGYELTLVRVDALSRAFGYVFYLVAVLSALYAFHVRDTTQHVAGMVYAGAAVAALFAGDLITLFVYWELTALSSVFLIWARKSERSYRAGLRYLVIQVGSGVLLLAGVLLHSGVPPTGGSGSIAFGKLVAEDGTLASSGAGAILIFLAFGIKCAFPFLHNWLQDAYPEATVTGTVFLSAFTTKLAVYALARGFPGTTILIAIGVAMTLFPIFYAVIENDMRRVLAYSLNNQLGFMVVGIGVGTAMSLNGTVAHAFCHILYKALLFMSMGAVLYRAGTIKASEIGGLYRSMPLTAIFCMVGAASISAFPLFSGFVSKGLIIASVADGHMTLVWLLLLVASAGVMEHSGIKIPFFSFFGHDSGIRCKEAPWNMLAAMGITAALCVILGCFPAALYDLLPNAMEPYQPYTADHVITQFQLLLFAALAFGVLIRYRLYPLEVPSVNLDFDWVYRKLAPSLGGAVAGVGARAWKGLLGAARSALDRVVGGAYRLHGPEGYFARTWTTGQIAFFAALMLGAYLILYLFW